MKRQLLMTALLLSAVALLPSMSFAHNIAGGCGSINDVQLSSQSNWEDLCSKKLNLTDGKHYCVATASAQVTNPIGSVSNFYLFTIDTDSNPITNSEAERTVELDDNGGISEPDDVVVSTARSFTLGAGSYTFHWLGRVKDDTTVDTTVEDYSMGIVCVDGK